jgi:hypothetical protein
MDRECVLISGTLALVSTVELESLEPVDLTVATEAERLWPSSRGLRGGEDRRLTRSCELEPPFPFVEFLSCESRVSTGPARDSLLDAVRDVGRELPELNAFAREPERERVPV